MDNLEDPQFDRLLQQKLNARIVPAPKELWSSIGQALDKAEAQDAQLDKSLQEQFSSFERKAPMGLWGAIEGALPNEEKLDGDALLDQKVREAYQQSNQAPEQIWYNIDQQLNVDTIWRNMQPRLNHMRKGYLWRKRLRQLSVAAMLLLLIRGCGLDFFPQQSEERVEQISEQRTTPSPQSDLSLKKESILAQKDKLEDEKPLPIVVFPRENAKKEASQSNLQNTKALNQEKDFKDSKVFPLETIQLNSIDKDKALSTDSTTKSFRDRVLPAALVSALSYKNELTSLNTEGFHSPKLLQTDFYPFQEVGLIAGVYHSVILNDATPKSLLLQTASRVDRKILAAPSFGLLINHHFHPKHAVAFEFWWTSSIRQKYKYAYAGKQFSQEVNLRYVKMAAIYELNLHEYKFLGREQKLLLRAGGYLANLQNQKRLSSNQRSNNLPLPEANAWDSGLVLAVGEDYQLLKNLKLSYGFRTEIGLTSLVERSKQAFKGSSNLLNLGFNISLSYRL